MTEAGAGIMSEKSVVADRRVMAVVVTYFPDMAVLGALVDAIRCQVDGIVVVDNGSGLAPEAWLPVAAGASIHVIEFGENRGVAAGQNAGIAWARSARATHVLLLDQDSQPASTMVVRLTAAIDKLTNEGIRVAAVGPRYADSRFRRDKPFVRLAGWRVMRLGCQGSGQLVEVDHLISSGSLIPLAAIDDVGGMEEMLFVDYVDTEWALRAIRKGYRLFGVCDATMRHGLGDEPARFFGRDVPVHGPLRHYYLFRNGLWLCRRAAMPVGWKLATLRRLVMMGIFFALLGTNRLAHLAMMARGLTDGWRDRMGRCPWADPTCKAAS